MLISEYSWYSGPVLISSEPAIMSAAISIEYDSLLLLVFMSNPKCLTSVFSMPTLIGSRSSLCISDTVASGSAAMFSATEYVFCRKSFMIFCGVCCLRISSAIFGFEYSTKSNCG